MLSQGRSSQNHPNRKTVALQPDVARCVALALLLAATNIVPVFAQQPEVSDPFQNLNRDIYAFNVKADRYLTKPLARGYRAITPNLVERAIGRFFDNLGEVGSAVNNLGQGKLRASGSNVLRFAVNSTVGIAGLIEVAEPLGLKKRDQEDFGQTLAVWGVKSGPYVVIPFLGPATVRDAWAQIVDAGMQPVNNVEDVPTRNGLRALEIVIIRASYLDAERVLPQKDPYVFVRDAYMQRRNYLIKDGAVEDDFTSDTTDDFLD